MEQVKAVQVEGRLDEIESAINFWCGQGWQLVSVEYGECREIVAGGGMWGYQAILTFRRAA